MLSVEGRNRRMMRYLKASRRFNLRSFTEEGRIAVRLATSFTTLDSTKQKLFLFVGSNGIESKPVKLEASFTVIFPCGKCPLIELFPAQYNCGKVIFNQDCTIGLDSRILAR